MSVDKVVDALAKPPGVVVEPGWGKGNVVLKLGDKIFAIASDERFVAKLPKARVDELVAAGAGTRFDPRKNGRVMKEWLVVADAGRRLELGREALAFARANAVSGGGRRASAASRRAGTSPRRGRSRS